VSKKVVTYLVHDFLNQKLSVQQGQRKLLSYIYSIGCGVNKNLLADIPTVESDGGGDIWIKDEHDNPIVIIEEFRE
jgi:hypothetical protein